MRPDLPAENVYGHTKKLGYILEHIDAFRRARSGRIRVLDFGCGNGEAVSRFLIAEGVDYTGIDFHAASLEHARKRFAGPGARFWPELPREGEYDVLVYSDVIEHLLDPAGLLTLHRHHLAGDGLLIGAVPNGWGAFELESWFIRRVGGGRLLDRFARHVLRADSRESTDDVALPYNTENGHLQFFTRRSLARVLGSAGFEIEDLRNGAAVGGPITGRLLHSQRAMRANNALAERMPGWAVSTWHFTARPRPRLQAQAQAQAQPQAQLGNEEPRP